jgi:hypothetical protein
VGVTVTWDNEERTRLRWDFEEKWTWDEYYQADQQARTMMEGVSYSIGGIVNLQKSTSLPPETLTHFRRIATNPIPNISISVIVGANALVTAFYKIFRSLYGSAAEKFAFANTIEEARTFISHRLANPLKT